MRNLTKTELAGSAVDMLLDPVTDYIRHVFQLTNFVVLCCIFSFFGIGANIVNILVFIKQGFKDTINISLLGLAVSDLACLLTMFWMCVCYNFLLHDVDVPFEPVDVMYLTGGWNHVCFNRVTSFITAFITLERCLCIVMPLKVKNIITPSRTRAIIVFIYLCTITLFSPFYFVNKLEWGFSVNRNKSILGIAFTEDRETVESVTAFIHSVFLSSVLLLTVVICTIILIVKLNQKSKWRETSVVQSDSKQDVASTKEKKVVKMIILIATIFLACFIPPTLTFLVMVLFPEFTVGGRYQNLLFVVWSVLSVLDAINSSVNIIVYYKMSTKYRVTLKAMLHTFSIKSTLLFLN